MPGDIAIGERIQQRRKLLGLSVRQVADRAGLSASTLSRIERGLRSADNRFVLAAIAEALRCPAADLTGQPQAPTDRRTAEASAGIQEVIRAAVDADLRYGPLNSAPPTPITQLRRELDLVADLRMRCDYSGARGRLPALILGLHAAAYGPDRLAALRSLVVAQHEAASVLKYSGDPGGACLVAERAQQAAEALDDPVLLGLSAFARAHAASATGRYERGALIAEHAADTLDHHTGQPAVQEMLGMLHLTAAFCRRPTGGAAPARVAAAEELAARTGETTTLHLHFGPTNVRIWQIGMETDGGDPGRAVEIARDTKVDLVPSPSRRTTYHLDIGRALAGMGRDVEAVRQLLAAERMSPQRIRSSPFAAETARSLLERSRRNAAGTELRGLCSRMGIAL